MNRKSRQCEKSWRFCSIVAGLEGFRDRYSRLALAFGCFDVDCCKTLQKEE
jgi:hypothetical protein